MAKQRWIVAPPSRTPPAGGAADWQAVIRQMPDVQVLGGSERRMQISAPEDAVAEIRRRFGDGLRIEPAIEHHP